MKDEIKEILQSLEKIAKCEYYPEDLLYYENCQKLLNYINDLQQEIVDYKWKYNLMVKFKNKALTKEHEYKSRIDKALCCLKSTDGNVFDYMIIEDAIDILKGE